MSVLELVLRHAASSHGGEPDFWSHMLPLVGPGIEKLIELMPPSLASEFRAFLDKEMSP